ncbi:hypothetical protein [Nannocystis sp. SCPEA4]|uniref:hypothetical protein n=1 Tax=Nannocystis sp. SCPEA4 TaxID=2996787 RepID=UPI00227148B8|nr:hypothetical protein [Nannocystis sp. SCPEA4]MCY1058930.1 hypothetical protein [Nannocystis sp. SCPEA4]
MSRRAVGLALLAVTCGEARVAQPAPAPASVATPAATATTPATESVPTTNSPTLVVEADDRTCASDGDCTAILTQCSMCEGACTGVRVDRAARYDGKLDCAGYHGVVCNYDCRPSFKIEAPRCVAGRCESVRIR